MQVYFFSFSFHFCPIPGIGPGLSGPPGGLEDPSGTRGVAPVARPSPQRPRILPEAAAEATGEQQRAQLESPTGTAVAGEGGGSMVAGQEALKAQWWQEKVAVASSSKTTGWGALRPQSSGGQLQHTGAGWAQG